MAEWKRDMQSIVIQQQQPTSSQQQQHYVIKEDQSQSQNSIISYLEIIDTNRLDSALFTCTITNPFGTDICNIQLIVQGMVGCYCSNIFFFILKFSFSIQ